MHLPSLVKYKRVMGERKANFRQRPGSRALIPKNAFGLVLLGGWRILKRLRRLRVAYSLCDFVLCASFVRFLYRGPGHTECSKSSIARYVRRQALGEEFTE